MNGFVAVVDPTQRWIYVAVPKCACTAVMHALRAHFGLPRVNNPHGLSWPNMASRQWVAEHPEYHRWAVIRDPYQRLVSIWADKCRPMSGGLAASRSAFYSRLEGCSFAEFMHELIEVDFDAACERTEKHLRAQSWYLTYKGHLIVDDLIPVDTLPERWKGLRMHYDFPALEDFNRQSHQEYVREFYACDYDLLDRWLQPT